MIDRLKIEKCQALFYALAISAGILTGAVNPEFTNLLELILWPVLAFLLYVAFSQIPVAHIPRTFFNIRFLSAALIGNFVIIPMIVALLISLMPDDPVMKLGVALVLLVPCTDWFLTFTQLGKGDLKYAVTLAPIILICQFLLLPVYIILIFGTEFTISIAGSKLIEMFVWFIAIPLLAAYLTQRLAEKKVVWKTG